MVQRRKINIKDVADRAGVHPSTVSRVLNPDSKSKVSDTVANRVRKIASQMGYRRSPLASGLRTGRSHMIGIMIPDLTNPLFPPMVRSIEQYLINQGYIAILADSDNRQAEERTLLNSMKSRQIDGIILATARRKDPVVDSCVEDRIPLVLVNRGTDTRGVASVINDDAQGIEQAVFHLVDLGHENIAFIGGPQNTLTGHNRFRAFKNLLQEKRFKSHTELMVNCRTFSETDGYRAMCKILKIKHKFSAVVVSNDMLALGCYRAFKEFNIKCPEDISITGFNDMPFMDKISPALTTIRIRHHEMGRLAAELLLGQIRSPETAEKATITLEPDLIVRESTGTPAC